MQPVHQKHIRDVRIHSRVLINAALGRTQRLLQENRVGKKHMHYHKDSNHESDLEMDLAGWWLFSD